MFITVVLLLLNHVLVEELTNDPINDHHGEKVFLRPQNPHVRHLQNSYEFFNIEKMAAATQKRTTRKIIVMTVADASNISLACLFTSSLSTKALLMAVK